MNKIKLLLPLVSLLMAAGVTKAQNDNAPVEFENPIISGFHPDPSVCRVGEDYYLVNSSFEWFPSIPIFKSRDLVNWELIGYGVTRPGQADLPKGLRDTGGVYAATIRYHEGLFYIITTNIDCGGNYYITATDPAGEWSDPVWLDAQGFDPSLFWEDDGRCYYVGKGVVAPKRHAGDTHGVWMQELDLEQKKLVGEKKQLTYGHAVNAICTEGPHLYKIDGKYILLAAEGGTGYNHAVSAFESDKLWGPYTAQVINPVMTHRHLGRDYPIQAVGHADLVETQNGEWWAVMLAKRIRNGHCYLGRETFLTPVSFIKMRDEIGRRYDAPIFNPNEGKLLDRQQRPDLEWSPCEPVAARDEFDGSELDLRWNFLRTPLSVWHECTKGALEIELRPEVADSLTTPSLIAQRITDFKFRAECEMEFKSNKSNEEAGIIVYRTSQAHVKMVRSGESVSLISTRKGERAVIETIKCSKSSSIVMSVECDGKDLSFSFKQNGVEYKFAQTQPFSIISDEEVKSFSGPFVGMYASSNGKPSKAKASFEWFEYQNL